MSRGQVLRCASRLGEYINNASFFVYNACKFYNNASFPPFQVEAFTDLLEKKRMVAQARALRNQSVRRVKMPWRNNKNKVDYAIYAMRHMETYMGTQTWNSGIKKTADRQIRYFRAKYCTALLCSSENAFRNQVKTTATEHDNNSNGNGMVDVHRMMHNYGQH